MQRRKVSVARRTPESYLDDYEVNGRHGKITFSRKPHEIDQNNLSVVAFLQEEQSKRVLQTAYVKLAPSSSQMR